MLRLLWLLAVISALAPTVLPVMALRVAAQEANDYDSTCYLRIEGQGTQNLARLCGKKTKQPGNPATQRSAVPAAQTSPLATDPDADTDDEEATTPVPRSSIPSTSFPPATAPLTQPPVAQPSASQQPTLPPTKLTPNQAPGQDVRLLPVPRPPEKRQPRQSPKARVASRLSPRSISPPSPPALKPRLPPTPPQTAAPLAQAAPLPSVVDSRSPIPTVSPQTSPLETLFQQLMQQKYLYLFWVLFLQVPLLKVAIDRRSRLKPQTCKPPTRLRQFTSPKRQPQSTDDQAPEQISKPDVVMTQPDDRVAADEAALAIALHAETQTQAHITRAAEFDLSQADNQIAQIKVILASAVRNRVSDIHLEPTTEGLRVRYRIDGILRDVTMLPLEVSRRTIVALKVMAAMDIAESRRPQDARISEQYASATTDKLDLDLRVSTLPCVGGEKAVIRLLPRQNPFSKMDDLGFTPRALALYQGWLQQPQGMILFTGPTGSGKTSTLYTSLQAIATEHVNVVTVEDPVEYILPCITQTQVNETAGMTFPAGLRAILRQDPDIIMVGEIRDSETAETAIRAALTGHLVLTTLHTNDAVGAIPRLKDVGPDPGLISDALLGVVAQRLVRRVCPHCAEPYTPTETDLRTLGLSLAEANPQAWRHGRGCSNCFHSGYAGREAIIELLHVDAVIRQLIYEGSLSELMDYLDKSEFDSFRKAAIAKVTAGITTIAEIRRVLPASKLASNS